MKFDYFANLYLPIAKSVQCPYIVVILDEFANFLRPNRYLLADSPNVSSANFSSLTVIITNYTKYGYVATITLSLCSRKTSK